MSKRPLIIAFFIIITAYLGNGIYDSKMKLKEGFFLDHNYEMTVEGGFFFELYFVDNYSTENPVVRIELPELEYMNSFTHAQHHGQYGKQSMYSFTFDSSRYGSEFWESLIGKEINEVTVYYAGGKSSILPIGSIRFLEHDSLYHEAILNENSPFQFNYSSSSNGAGVQAVDAQEALTLSAGKPGQAIPSIPSFCYKLRVDHATPNSKRPREYMNTACNEPSFPFHLEQGDRLVLEYSFSNQAEEDEVILYNFQLHLEGTRENGDPLRYPFAHIRSVIPSAESIKSLIKQKRSEAS